MILNDFTLGLSEFVLGDMRSAFKFMMQNNVPQLMHMINRIIERIKVILSAKLAALNAFNKSTKRQSVKHTTIHHNKINSTKRHVNIRIIFFFFSSINIERKSKFDNNVKQSTAINSMAR